MAFLSIAEFRSANRTAQGFVTSHRVSIGASSTQSQALDASTRTIRISARTACHFQTWSDDPTADSDSPEVAAGQTEYFSVEPGKSWKVAVIEQQS